MLRAMAENGQRATRADGGRPSDKLSLGSLGVSPKDSSRWQRVAKVPEEVRQEYVETVRAAGDEV